MQSKKYRLFLTVLFYALLGGGMILHLLMPDRPFSEQENRYLQSLPKLSAARVWNGSFSKEWEAYCADQFPFRDASITAHARYETFLGKKESNGIVLSSSGRLLEPFRSPSGKELARRAEVVNTFAAANPALPVTLALIPGSGELYRDEMPAGIRNDSQAETINEIYSMVTVPAVDLCSPLKAHSDEYIFYRTDHHWTTLGAACALEAMKDSLGVASSGTFTIKPETVSDSFYGTAYSSSGYTWVIPDSIMTLIPEPEQVSVRTVVSSEEVPGSLYCYDRLALKDKYTFFLGGNTPEVRISNPDAPQDACLLLIRDSFSDSLAPFLAAEFREIRLLDLRYYYGSVSDYVRENGVDRVLILYSLENFVSDTDFLRLE